jgi:hypothetical protein
VIKRDAWTNLAPVVDKGNLDFLVRAPKNICDLSGNPSLFFICEPDPGSLGVNVLCHGPRRSRRDDCLALLVLPLITGLSHGHLIAIKTKTWKSKKKILDARLE